MLHHSNRSLEMSHWQKGTWYFFLSLPENCVPIKVQSPTIPWNSEKVILFCIVAQLCFSPPFHKSGGSYTMPEPVVICWQVTSNLPWRVSEVCEIDSQGVISLTPTKLPPFLRVSTAEQGAEHRAPESYSDTLTTKPHWLPNQSLFEWWLG